MGQGGRKQLRSSQIHRQSQSISSFLKRKSGDHYRPWRVLIQSLLFVSKGPGDQVFTRKRGTSRGHINNWSCRHFYIRMALLIQNTGKWHSLVKEKIRRPYF